ncbi:hypothetical protein OG496_27955 [Streptomyces sp. NBC_00988]|uniref:hypothetical protein n=1 Tax=Streptomyces sp. NBC_00988 TaxID=2903704 RepID=UPI003864242B|nr:hypothetical protein OG496_27955 [Streptomyces sp. NBC_00988]
MSGKAGDDFTDQTDQTDGTGQTDRTGQYAYESALADALGGLGSGVEPPMPDLVPGAVVRGARIRRRRRVGATVSAAVMAGVVALGGHALLAPRPESTPRLPAGQPSVWSPSLELVRSILSAGNGAGTTVSAEQPRQPLRPGRYFRMTAADGSVNDLYVSVSRTATDPSYAHPTRACLDSNGRVLASPWNGLITRCSLTERGSGSLLFYYVADRSLATGVTYLTPGGWTVQVIAGTLDETATGRSGSGPRTGPLTQLATDPRIFDAVKGSGGG